MLKNASIRVPNIVVPSLSSLALKYGLSPEHVFSHSGIDLANTTLHELDLDLQQVEAVMETIAQDADLPQVGLLLGEHVQAEMLGVFGPLIASSPSTRVAIESFSRFKQLLHPMFDMQLTESDQQSIITYASRDAMPIGSKPFYAESLFTALVHLGSMFTGKDVPPLRVEFRHSQPSYPEEYQRIFRCEVVFDCDVDRMMGQRDILDSPMLSHSFSLHQLLKQQASQQLGESSIKRQVKSHLQQAQVAAINATDIAAQLNISPRTLQRQLAKEETSFKQLRDEAVLEQAQRLLSTTQLSTEAIALALGYTDRSNFVHAFKRISGLSPSEYRDSV